VKFYCTDHFAVGLLEGHTFPMAKYARLRQRVVAATLVAPEDLSAAGPPDCQWP
jgi:hypothetical protein